MSIIKLHDLHFKPFIDKNEISVIVKHLAQQVKADLPKDEVPIFVGILNGCFLFAADFIREFNGNCEVSFVQLASYKGTATEGANNYDNVLVYPNPVKPGFEGVVAIKGLLKDTEVRIADISGNIVYQTTSFGGQAVWDGKDFNGNKVQTGVYIVFNGSPEGELKAVAKILFIH
mgnify:CR=1 FL=1